VKPTTCDRHTDERGQILVIVAGGILALLVFLGLVIDGGNAFLNRRDAQNTADIAALDATRLIGDGYVSSTTPGANTRTRQDIWNEIQKSAEVSNGCVADGATPCTWQAWFVGGSASGPIDQAEVTDTAAALPANTLGVRVAVNRRPGTFLARLADMPAWDINTEAIALAETPGVAPAGQLLPIAFKGQAGGYEPGQVYDITDGKDDPGGFGYISWTGSNDPNALSTSICTPDNPELYLPVLIAQDPGKSNSTDVRACLDKWIGSKQTVLIPIYDTIVDKGGNNAKYKIVGVAAFVLTARDQPAVDNIRGYFVEIYPYTNPVPGGVGSGVPQPGDSSYFLGLVK
jgi:Flp pilus assembly protein TadG